MAVNPYFDKYNVPSEQSLLRDLCEEAIQVNGFEIYYILRTDGESLDLFLGEDPLAKFTINAPMEAYVSNVQGWDGQGDLISKFVGLQLNDKITFTIARHRWVQEITAKLMAESGEMLAEETAIQGAYTQSTYDYTDGVLLEGTQPTLSARPREGDLIYVPMINKLFAVRFVEHEKMFYPLGILLTYDFTCELYDYSSERLTTTITNVDAVDTIYSTDLLKHVILLEASAGDLLDEDLEPLLEEGDTDSTAVERHDFFANNALIQQLADLDLIFDQVHPFQSNDTF